MPGRSASKRAREYLGTACHALGQLTEAVGHLQVALDRHRQIGNRHGEGAALVVLALVMLDLGDQEQARELAETASELAGQIRHDGVRMAALNALGTVALRTGEPAQAAARYAEAAALADRLGQPFPEIEALIGQAAAAAGLGRVTQATALGRRAQVRARRHGYRLLEAHAAAVLAAPDRSPALPTPRGDRPLGRAEQSGDVPAPDLVSPTSATKR